MYTIQMGRYTSIKNIVNILPILIYLYCIGTLLKTSVFRYIDVVSVTSEISDIFDILSCFFRLVNLKTDNYMNKIIWQCDATLHLVTSLLVRNGS